MIRALQTPVQLRLKAPIAILLSVMIWTLLLSPSNAMATMLTNWPVVINPKTMSHFKPVTSRISSSDQWKWHTPESAEIESSSFMFGGRELKLSDVPADVKIEAMVVPELCRFAQWHFGDSNSTRLSILIEMDGKEINRLFIDSNRDRKIEDSEQLSNTTNQGKTWLANVDVEVREKGNAIHAKRQIGITVKRNKKSVRVTTLGYAQGQVELDGKELLVRRVDLDGNGLPIDSRDQIWIDLNQDGKFDLLDERQSLKSYIQIAGRRYTVRSDQLGHSLILAEENEMGKILFVFELADKTSKLETLEGSLRDEAGMLTAIRPSSEAVAVPAGRYCVENLVIEARDSENNLWRMTLTRGFDTGWFEVKADEQHDLKLLDSIKFRAKPVHQRDQWSGRMTHLEPKIYTPNGLIVTDFTCDKLKEDWRPNSQSVRAEFKVQTGPNDEHATECKSGFN